MEYNTSREKLVMPEYGRNIQEMVRHALTIEDRDERSRCAATIAKTMITLFPKLKEDDNYKQKVWDHIAMMANYQLDVDAPYPLPTQQEAAAHVTTHIPYPMKSIRLRAYGSIVQDMLQAAVNAQTEDERIQIAARTAAFMKRLIIQGGKETNAEDRVCADMSDLTNGELQYDFAEMMSALPEGGNNGGRRQWQNRGGRNNGGQRYHYNRGGRTNNGGGNNNGRRNNNRKRW